MHTFRKVGVADLPPIRGWSPREGVLLDAGAPAPVVLAEDTDPVATTTDDCNYIHSDSAEIRYDYAMNMVGNNAESLAVPAKSFTSRDEAIGTVDQNGYVTRVANGTVVIEVIGQFNTKHLIEVPVSLDASAEIDEFTSFVSGSLAAAFVEGVDALIAGLDPAAATPVFSSRGGDSGPYVRNPALWLPNGATLLSGISARGPGTYKRPMTLVTPQHVLQAKHYGGLTTPAQYTWISPTGEKVVRNVTHQAVSSEAGYDVKICRLDAPITEAEDEIPFLKVTPILSGYLGEKFGKAAADEGINNITSLYTLPFFRVLQDGNLTMGPMQTVRTPDYFQENLSYLNGDEPYYDWYSRAVNGDSGAAMLIWTGSEVAIAGPISFGGSGAFQTATKAIIDPLIAEVDAAAGSATGFTATEVDLSSFPTY